MADPTLSGAVVVDAAQSQYLKKPQETSARLIARTVARLIRESGFLPQEIDGLAITSFQLAPDNVVTMAEQIGLSPRWAWQGAHGGASGVISVIEAAAAITAGRASAVVCAAGDSFDVNGHFAHLDRSFNSAMRDYLAPYPFGGTNGLFAMVERQHRDLYGTTREVLGKLAVTQRSHAMLNDNALLRSPLTLEEYLDARIIADPVRLFDCVMPCSGAEAVLVVSRELAEARGLTGVEVLGGGQQHNNEPNAVLSLSCGAEAYADQMFAAAGVARDELDFLQLYDDYPIMELIQLEDLGFAVKGSGGDFVSEHRFDLRGDFPLNTGGGQLSCGQSGAGGGTIGVFEAITQLLGRGGDRQVPGARTGLVSGFGMVGYGKGLSSSAMILKGGTR